MNDPHVERLYYEVGTGSETISYSDPEPLTVTNELGSFSLTPGALEVAPAEHFPDEDQARPALEPYLRAWEVAADLRGNPGAIRFKFLRAHVIDRSPPQPGRSATVRVRAGELVVAGSTATARLTLRHYPAPPQTFLSTTDVELGHRRWLRFREGKEPLPGMAYFVLDLLRTRAGNKEKAAEVFGISRNVLSTLGRLSNRGDALTARHAKRRRDFKELTGAESSWLEHAVRRLLLRMGEHAAGVALPKITMADLPSL